MVQEETAQRFRVYDFKYYTYNCCCYSVYIYICVYFRAICIDENQGSPSATIYIDCYYEFYERKYEIVECDEMSKKGDVDCGCMQQ